jgi:tRNA modification GTPase
VATPPGFGGVGIVRVSGPLVRAIAEAVASRLPPPRVATLARFADADGSSLDQGLVLYFPAPHSFTGEDVLELQGHGGPVVLDLLLRRLCGLGARLARPGEFSERAFLNGKLDLAQAEAVADLIESGSEIAARLAARTLEGELSRRVEALVEGLIELRAYLEAALDFPDEDIDFVASPQVATALDRLAAETEELILSARQGQLVREGIRVVIAGAPNAGKSSLLNALARTEAAIVTEVPGTTRDLLRQEIRIDGMPLQLTDTAGLRASADPVEQEGMRRARKEMHNADRVLWIFDGSADPDHRLFDPAELPAGVPVTFIRNKIDLLGEPPGQRVVPAGVEIGLSARTGAGLEQLCRHLVEVAGYRVGEGGSFLARRRHLEALQRALDHLGDAATTLARTGSGELVAEDLRQAQRALGEITGTFTADDLLGRIFASFCIGK